MSYGNTGLIIQGPAKIYVDYGLGGGYEAVGLTQGDLKVGYNPQWGQITAHQLGKAPADYRFEGATATIKFDCLERTNTNLKLAIPTASISVGTGEAVNFGIPLGARLSDYAVKVKVHPMNHLGAGGEDDESYLTDDYTFWKCASMLAFEDNLNGEADRLYPVELTAMPDLTKGQSQMLFIKGDPADAAIDSTPPTVSDVQAEVSNVATSIPVGDLASVDADTVITVTFSESVKSAQMIQPYVTLVADSDKTVVPCTYVYDSTTFKLTLTPASVLTSTAKYHVSVAAVQDLTGNIQSGTYIRSFTIA